MDKETKKKEVFHLVCPCCSSVLWIDPVTHEVIQFERAGAKKKKSLNELLSKEEKRQSGFERKFEATVDLEKRRKEKVREGFRKALLDVEKED